MGFARKDVERTKMNAKNSSAIRKGLKIQSRSDKISGIGKRGQGGLQNRQGGVGQL